MSAASKPGMPLLCRLGRHKWDIWFVAADGHQSKRARRCVRCLHIDGGVHEEQQLSYFLKPIGPWVRR
jgi:hypothetical protein